MSEVENGLFVLYSAVCPSIVLVWAAQRSAVFSQYNIPDVSSATACQCDAEGTILEGCNKKTGACLCRPGVTGSRCDSCSRGHCDSFPACETCPSCFFTLDAQRQNLSLALKSFLTRPGGSGVHVGDFVPRIRALEARLNLIRNSISLPPSTTQQVNDALSQLDMLRWGTADVSSWNRSNKLHVVKLL